MRREFYSKPFEFAGGSGVKIAAHAGFRDEKVDTIECESAEAALAVMLIGGREVAMIFADVRLPGAMGGVDLACEVKLRWPLLPMILSGPSSSSLRL